MSTQSVVASLLAGLLTTAVAQSALAARFEVATGEFDATEWFTLGLPGLSGDGESVTVAAGGNPGAFRRIALTVNPLDSAFQASLWTTSAFSPASAGAVRSASLSFDYTRVASTLPSANQVVGGIAVFQNGALQLLSAGVTTLASPAWASTGTIDLVQRLPTIDWQSGGEIVFGIYNIVTALTESFTIAGGYDNFRLSIEYAPRSVPLPATLPLLAGALGLTAFRLGRRRA